jgi:hydroxymethylpyrimidine pyrophosphatase-like HAD family hydrolase
VVLEKSLDRGKAIKIKTDEKEKKDYHRQLCERLHLDSPRDHLSPISAQKFGAEKTAHPVESGKEAPSLPDDQRHQAMLSRNDEMIRARVIKFGKQGETYAWKPLSMEEMRKSDAVFLPKYVAENDYPLYYEQLKETGNFDAKTSMGASVRLMRTEAGEQYVVKRAAVGEEHDHLLRQVRRMQEMRAEGIAIIPELVDVNIQDRELYYIMPYIKGEAADKAFFENMTDEEFLGKLDTMLSHVDQELWLKGGYSSEQHHFSQRHLCSIERGLEGTRNVSSQEIRILLERETFTANGEQVTNLPVLLSWIKQSSPLLDRIFATAKVPDFTHGDLHFGNILFDEAGKPLLIDINGKEEREKSIAEFEASRILLSFYRQILRNNEYRIMQNESGECRLQYTEKGLEILQRRQQALDAIMEHPDMQKWFGNKEQSRHMIELLEAIHIVTVFHKRPDEQQLITYVFGTQLLEQAIKKSGFCDTAILEYEKQDRLWTPFKRDIGTEAFEIARRNFLKYRLDNIESVWHEMQTTKLERDGARNLFARMVSDGGALLSDVDHTLIDSTQREKGMTMPEGFVESAKELVNDGIPVAIITGRPVDIVIKNLQNGGATQEIIDKIEIYGEYGVTYRGPSTDGKTVVSDKNAEIYVTLAKELLDTIEQRISEDSELEEFTERGKENLPLIGLSRKTLGATVQGRRHSRNLRDYLEGRVQQGASINVEEKVKFVDRKLNEIISSVLKDKEDYKAFCKYDQDNSVGIEIRLNADTTGIEISKGMAAASLVKRLKLKSVVFYGDDIPDLDVPKALLQFIAANKHVDGYISDRGKRIELLKKSISRLTPQDKSLSPTKDEIQARTEKIPLRNQLNEEFLSLHKNTVQSQAFVGVKHPQGMLPTEAAIIEASSFMVEGPDDAVAFIEEMADEIIKMRKLTEET